MFVPHDFVLFKNVQLGILGFSVSFILAHTWLSLCPLHGQALRDLGSAPSELCTCGLQCICGGFLVKPGSESGASDSNKPHHTTMRMKPLLQ